MLFPKNKKKAHRLDAELTEKTREKKDLYVTFLPEQTGGQK